MTRSSIQLLETAGRQETPEAIDRAIVRAEITVARLKGTLRFLAAVGLSQDNARKRLQAAEQHVEALHSARAILLATRARGRRAS